MSIHLDRIYTCPCFIVYIVYKQDQTNDIHLRLAYRRQTRPQAGPAATGRAEALARPWPAARPALCFIVNLVR